MFIENLWTLTVVTGYSCVERIIKLEKEDVFLQYEFN